MRIFAALLAGGVLLPALWGQPAFAPFDPDYRAKARPVRIVAESEAQGLKAPVALVRLSNRKLALKVRDSSGRFQPFYVIGLGGTGYWRKQPPTAAELGATFANYRKLGANTCLYGIHWRDFEPEEGKFDFRYLDMVVDAAARQGLKTWWVLFMHFQPDSWPEPGLEKFWVYNLDSRDGADYAVQWLRDDQGNTYSNMGSLLKSQIEVFPAYGHARVFPAVVRMLRGLARQYRDSGTVVGLQLGNEEGFATAPWRDQVVTKDWRTDVNPVTLGLYADWSEKTGKSDRVAFKLDMVKYWWSRFASAFHEEDPYKPISFNLMTGGPEAGYEWWVSQEGVDSTTYGEGNIDVIAPMFHRPISAQMWANLDGHYSYLYRLPILIPSEIGIGRSLEMFQQHVIDTLERGGQGYAVWSYSPAMVGGAQGQSASGASFQRLAAMVEANADVLHPGVPGPGEVALETSSGARISQLHSEAGTLGILHFPRVYNTKLGPQDWDQARAFKLWQAEQQGKPALEKSNIEVMLTAARTGRYSIQVYRNGTPDPARTEALRQTETRSFTVPAVAGTEAVFLRVKRLKP